MSRRSSLTARLTLLFATASSLVLLALGLVIGSAMERHFEEQDIDTLGGKLELISHAIDQLRGTGEGTPLPQALAQAFVGHHELAILVLDADRQTVFSAGDARFPVMAPIASTAEATATPFVWSQGETQYRALATRIADPAHPGQQLIVAVAIDIAHHTQFMASFSRTLWLFMLGAALVSGLLGWFAARRGLASLQQVARQTATVTANKLDFRLAEDTVPTELSELVRSLNDMLARLEDAFQRLSDFSSDLAHELRTPISNLMTQTHVALSRARDAEDYRDILASNAEEFERMARMVSDMLFLAKSDNGQVIPNRQSVDLGAEVAALFEFYDALAEDKGVTLTQDGAVSVSGDPLMLRRALSNLLSNAVRHASADSLVRVRLDETADGARIRVENHGETLPAETLPRFFERFYRADPSRHHTSEGAGLGLAITRSIIVAHGGSIAVESRDGVTAFEITLPCA